MDTAALKQSWATVTEAGDEVPLYFYSHLFLTKPELRQLFPISMSAQRDKLVSALGTVIANVDELENAVPFLQQLGRDHRRFAVKPEHYDAIGASLLATLQHFLGTSWTKELAEDWNTAYGIVARTMLQAAEQDSGSPAWWNANVVRVERRTFDLVVLQLRPEQPYQFRPGQSFAMEVPQRPRLWRYFSPANAPRPDGTIELHVQAVDGGQVSTAIVRSLRVGEEVRMGAPIGEALVWDPMAKNTDLLLIGGGTGVAPLRAILEQLDRIYRTGEDVPKTHLIHGARMPWGLYESHTLQALAERPWFTCTEVVSDDPAYSGARGLAGDVAAQSGLWQGRTTLVCGSAGMVEHTATRLREAGAGPDAVRYEKFAGTEGGQ